MERLRTQREKKKKKKEERRIKTQILRFFQLFFFFVSTSLVLSLSRSLLSVAAAPGGESTRAPLVARERHVQSPRWSQQRGTRTARERTAPTLPGGKAMDQLKKKDSACAAVVVDVDVDVLVLSPLFFLFFVSSSSFFFFFFFSERERRKKESESEGLVCRSGDSYSHLLSLLLLCRQSGEGKRAARAAASAASATAAPRERNNFFSHRSFFFSTLRLYDAAEGLSLQARQ